MKTAKKKMIQALNDLLLTFAFENGNLKIQILVQCQFYDLAVRCFCYFARSDRVNKQLTKNDELIFFLSTTIGRVCTVMASVCFR